MKNQVQLIAYADRFGGSLSGLHQLLAGPLHGLFGGVHILPFFHPIDGADAGFDPIDHTQVDPRLGSWDDIGAVADQVDVMADVIVNHISSRSPQFLDFSEKGAASEYAGMFLTFERVFPTGATEQQLLAIYRPRPGLPFTSMKLANGVHRILWTTFTAEQVDIDVRHARGIEYLERILARLAGSGVTMVRLDAVGYAVKRAGTNCFMTYETLEFVREFADRAARQGLEVLVEVHSHFEQQIEIARQVDRVYDFALPPLVLHALFEGTSRYLKRWIDIRPRNAITVLDTHDGIGIIDIAAGETQAGARPGIVPAEVLDRLVATIHANSNGESLRASGAAASNLDLYQVNCTFFDAMGRDELRYLLARAIQFFLPGVPQVYYVGLLAGENDVDLLERTRVGRDINRHYYATDEVERALEKPVVAALCALIRLRNSHPAFDGQFESIEAGDHALALRWQQGAEYALLEVDLRTCAHRLEYSQGAKIERLELSSAWGTAPAARTRQRTINDA